MDKIFIKNLEVYGILGIHPHEQRTPQVIRVSVNAKIDIGFAAQDDNIEKTVNYSTMAQNIIRFIEGSSFLTIEALIDALAVEILSDKRIQEVWLRIEKPNAVPQAESVGVEITRRQQA